MNGKSSDLFRPFFVLLQFDTNIQKQINNKSPDLTESIDLIKKNNELQIILLTHYPVNTLNSIIC